MQKKLCIFHADFNFVNIRPDYQRIWLKRLSDMGYNAILWELEDKVQWETCADTVWPEAMSKEDFRQILKEADELGLEAIPLLQTIGHAEYILKHKPYHHMRELPDRHDCYCTENPETRAFLKSLIKEYLELFGDIKHFHLGGDEAYVFAKCPKCAAEAERIGHNELYARHITDISEQIRAADIRAGIWCDMALHHPEEMDKIPQFFEIWDWNYSDSDGPMECVRIWGKGAVTSDKLTPEIKELYPEIIGADGKLRGFYTADMLKRMGYDVILCSAVRSHGDSFFCPKTEGHAGNIAGAARKAAVSDLVGTCVTDWAIRLNSWETHRTLLPIAPYIMENPEADMNTALQEITHDIFGCDASGFIEALNLISEINLPFGQSRSTAVQWTGMKDSLPAPANYIKDLLEKWTESGSIEKDKQAIDKSIGKITQGISMLNEFTLKAQKGFDILQFWTKAAWFQLWQARMAKEILCKNRSPENAAALKTLKTEYEHFLLFDQTPESAKQNANLVYDALIEYMENGKT